MRCWKMNDLQNFIISKGLEKASLETIKQAIIQDPYLSNDVKEFWIGVIRGYSISKDVSDVLDILNRRRWSVYDRSSIGLRRRGFSNELIENIHNTYRIIYQSGKNVSDALKQVREDIPMTPEIEYIVSFIENSKRGIIR